MRRPLYAFILLVSGILVAIGGAFLVQMLLAAPSTATADEAVGGSSAGERRGRHAIERDFFAQRAFQDGKPIPADGYDRAAQQWQRIPRAVPRGGAAGTGTTLRGISPTIAPSSAVTSLTGTSWTPIGPSPVFQGTSQVNGRVSAIAVNPGNGNLIYQGSSGGGVWRTTNGGTSWTPLYDQQATLGVGEPSAIAIDPSDTDTLYVGTSGRFVLNISKGILKSTDGGGSWIVLGSGFPADNTGNADDLFAGQHVNAIIVDPANSNVLYLGASNGLFRSTDGGRNWTQGTNGFGDARTLVLDRTSPAANRILFAGVDSSGIRRSTDGGQNWTQVLSAATPAVAAVLAGGGIGQVLVDLAPPTSPANATGIQVLYASMEGTGGAPDPVGLFRSTDQGGTWNRQTSTGIA
ncbi:MAG TPA: hypothetical protein VK132_03320, partial [Gemmatimonadales bacterium]|nr:hypothetical protein [Gemmatimonadales bacterium]